MTKPPVDKIQKQGAEEFRANIDDDPEKAEFWLESSIRVFDELSCTPKESLKCAVSLLRDSAYRLWKTLTSVVPRERMTWDFFLEEFRKQYISQRFIDRKSKEFLELKQGKISMVEYEREFVRLIEILELKELLVLVDRACKAEKLIKEKRKAMIEARDARKRPMSKSFQTQSKRSKEMNPRATASARYSHRDCGNTYSGSRLQATLMTSVACYKCSSLDHFIQNCPKKDEKDRKKEVRASNVPSRGRAQRNPGSGTTSRGVPRDSTVRSKGRAPARTYAIRAHEEASSPDVIMGTFSLHDISVVALIDLGSTHSYICMKLVSSMSMLVESTEFVIKVSNPLGKHVLVDKMCRNCPLTIRGHCFPANLMLLPFDEFDLILGMDWLTAHNVLVNCGSKFIELRCVNEDIIRVESGKSNSLPVVISSMAVEKCMRKGYESYLAYVLNAQESEVKIESVPIVREYSNMFLEELPGLPPVREVEFGIELVPGTAPISVASYRMAPLELKELKD
ncbi:alcohol-forming fatty acyl-CoA reductase-like [Gossypium australe]|uniref:Alcohol-forming fatty acyl-CoA reductase-like n=1 Tax=Gossypium australe TaxID=47621 RepID=A0A5B6WUJ2_9ROSI|nr:alcohol-forming fatty acyl-CoA reductase-like [Gossypium australe]